jgi:hypothetical protein
LTEKDSRSKVKCARQRDWDRGALQGEKCWWEASGKGNNELILKPGRRIEWCTSQIIIPTETSKFHLDKPATLQFSYTFRNSV